MPHTRRVGSGEFIYEEVKGWGELPTGWRFVEVAGVGVDSQDRVYVFSRSEHPLTVFDREGRFLGSWGKGFFTRPHGLFIGPDDAVYCVDDCGHAVHKFTTDGRLLMTIQTADHPSDTGYDGATTESVIRSGPPFNYPTALAVAPGGDLYVSDGYGNARIHRFTPDGQLVLSWGEPGDRPGQFVTPHDVCVDRDGRVYVCDRQNCRIQVFSPQGELIVLWRDVRWPCDVCLDADGHLYVAEVGGVFMGEPDLSRPSARITVRDSTGKVLAEWEEHDPSGAGQYFSPHGIACDSRGDLYVGEVAVSYPGGRAPADWCVLRKYVRG